MQALQKVLQILQINPPSAEGINIDLNLKYERLMKIRICMNMESFLA